MHKRLTYILVVVALALNGCGKGETRIAVRDSCTSKDKSINQKLVVVRNTEIFRSASVMDYELLNEAMGTYLAKVDAGLCEAYIIPGKDGPTLFILNYECHRPITERQVDAIFDMMGRDIKTRH